MLVNQSISSSDSGTFLRKKQLDGAAEAKKRTDHQEACDEQAKAQHQQQILITEATRQSSIVGAAGPCSINRQNSNVHNVFSPSCFDLTASHVTVGSRVMQEPCLRQSRQQQEEPGQVRAPQQALPQNVEDRALGDITFDITFRNEQLQNMREAEDQEMQAIDGRPTIVAQVSTPKAQNKQQPLPQ